MCFISFISNFTQFITSILSHISYRVWLFHKGHLEKFFRNQINKNCSVYYICRETKENHNNKSMDQPTKTKSTSNRITIK
jgi:hypothetical protein